MPKSDRVKDAALAADPVWTVEDTSSPGLYGLKLTRGDEEMTVNWSSENDGLVHPLDYRLRGVKEVRLRNVSAALKQIADAPNYKVRSKVPRERSEEAPETLERILPFDPETATDAEVIKAVCGKRLVWWNSMGAAYDSGEVPGRKRVEVADPNKVGEKKWVLRTSRNITIKVSSTGRRVLTFPAVGEQFRSVGLDSLVQVR